MALYTSPTDYLGLSNTNLTDTERNAPGGQSTYQGGVQSAYNAPITAPAPTPTASSVEPGVAAPTASSVEPGVAAPPTIGETLGGIKNEALRIQDILNQRQADESGDDFATSGYEALNPVEAVDPWDQDAEQRRATRNQMRLYQAEIDATNQVYDQLLNEARIQGQGRIGSQRAGAARGGLLGSDFAASQKDKVQGFNTDIQRGIGAERTAAIGAIEGNVRSAVAEEMKLKREARQQDADAYTEYLANKGTRKDNYKKSIVSDMLAQGFDISQFSEEELTSLLQGSGITPSAVIAEYAQQKNAGEAAAQGDQFTLKSGEKRYDSAGNVIAEGPADAKDFGTIYSTGQGLVRVNPETGNPELIFSSGSGGGSGGGETFKSGGLVVSGGEVATIQNDLSQWRGEDGKVKPQPYLSALDQWKENKGLEADFFKLFPPKEYVSTTDETFPKYIRDKAESSSTEKWWETDTPSTTGVESTVPETGAITEEGTGGWDFWNN